MGAALNRRRELRVRCAASASRSSAEAASSVLSTSPESWITRVGRGNASTRHSSIKFSKELGKLPVFKMPGCHDGLLHVSGEDGQLLLLSV